jgi:hypothetical protein
MPPAKIMTRLWFDELIPKNWSPGWLFWPSSLVEMSKALAVKALSRCRCCRARRRPCGRESLQIGAGVDDRHFIG